MADNWVLLWILLALILIPVQIRFPAPYGRHFATNWGKSIPSKTGWVIMESVALIAFTWFYLAGAKWTEVTILIASLFAAHYVHRSAIYPMMTKTSSRRIPLVIVGFAIVFNAVNGFINGDYLGVRAQQYPMSYLSDPRFIVGLILFITGALINVISDYTLIGLRKNGAGTDYLIPRGKLFSYISCPNHFGEIIEWIGFAVMCWNLPALAFAVWTASNLIPRAIHHHKWYRSHFPDYPDNRKAIFPFLL